MPQPRQRGPAVGPGALWRRVAPGLVLIVAVLLSYAPAIEGGFIWDDDVYVQNNVSLRSGEGLAGIWLRPGEVPQYYPLVFTSFWLEYHLWNLQPLGYHLTNVLLHGLNAVLLALVLRRLAVPGAWFAAALFALHPVHVESVAWITERKNVLSGVFYLAAILAYMRFAPLEEKPIENGGKGWYSLALILFIGALLSKTVTCSLPAVLVLLIWWKRGRITRRDGLALVPLFVLGAVLGLQTVWIEKHYVGAEGKEWSLSLLERMLVMGRALWFYASKLFWPQNLTFIYPRWQIDVHAWWQYVFPFGALAVIVTLWLGRGRIGRGPLCAILFFAGTLLPALGLFDVYPMRYSFVADHFQYLASAGLLALAAGLATIAFMRFFPGKRWMEIATGGAALLTLGLLTWQQGHVYHDVKTLWTDTLAKNPDCRMAHNNLGSAFARDGQFENALKHLRAAIDIDPNEPRAHHNLGELLAEMKKTTEAIEEFSTSIRLDPQHAARPHRGLGLVLAQQEKLDEAIEHLTMAVRMNPADPFSHFCLGMGLAEKGKLDEAIPEYEESLRLSPDQAQLHIDLGIALGQRGRLQEAAEHFAAAGQLEPHNLDAEANLGSTLALLNRPEEAVRHFTEQMRMDRRYAAAQYEVANAFARQGKIDEAIAWYRQAASLEPASRYRDGLNAALKQKADRERGNKTEGSK